ncbi:hypothetical protein L3Q82_008534, partial [Scortum barcoo]
PDSGVKMAAYSRAQLLRLLLVCSACLCSSALGLKAAGGPAEPPNPPGPRAADPPAKDAPAAAAGASQPRRATGWKLAEEEACREDLTRLCPKHTWTNNLAVLECLQDRREESEIAPDCNHLLWNYKLNLTTDPKFESVATEVCKSTISEIKECNEEERGRGYLVSCLVDHRSNISEYQCNQYITKMTSIIFSDYRLICGFMDKCKDDINNLHCGSINVGHKRRVSQDSPITSRDLRYSGRISSTPGALPPEELANYLSDFGLGDGRVQPQSPQPPLPQWKEGVSVGLRSSSKYSFHRPTTSPVEDTNNSKRPIPDPKAQGSDPLVHRGELQHMVAELGSYKQAHTSSPPLTLGNSRVVEGPAPLKEAGFQSPSHAWSPEDWVVEAPIATTATQTTLNTLAMSWPQDMANVNVTLLGGQLSPKVRCTGPSWTFLHVDVHSQGEVIACLEKALVREAEQQDHVRPIKEECKRAILRVAELSSDDFHLDRHLYFSCRDDRERFCQNTQAGEGKVYKCLFNHKFEEAMSEKCRDALTTRQKLISQDYRVSYSLAKACKLDLRKQRCSLDTNLPRAREARLSYLLLCLEAAVHRGRPVSGECQGEMLDYRRMLMEDFSLSPEIVLHCRTEIEAHCSGLHRKGRTLHCLMRIGRGDRSTTMDSVCQSALQTLIQSADPGADYRIDRALNEACESVIQTACKHIRNGDPMILSCLMEHLYTEKMVEDCEHRLLELQYFISRDWNRPTRPHPGAGPGVWARRRAPGGQWIFAHGTRPSSARNGDVGPPSSRLTTRRKVHEGPVQCGLSGSRGRGPRSKLWDARSLVPVVAVTLEPGIGHGSKGCRQAEEGVLSDHVGLWDSRTQLMGTGRPSKPQPGTVLEAKTRVWEEFGEAMRPWRKEFWQTVRRLRRGKHFSANTVQCGWGAVDLNWGHCRTVEEILRVAPQSHRHAFTEEAEAEDSEVDSSITQAKYQARTFQHVLERFAAECEAAGMRISTSKSEAMVLDRKRVACPLRVGGEVLPQVEEFKLDPILYKKCQGDAARLCHTHGWNETSELMPPGAVFSCLYRHAYRTEEQGRRLSRDCKVEVQRILHQRALDVKLDPELQKRCMTDLGKWCSEKTDAGQELECLQDHLEDLVSACRDVVGNLTELESEDIQIDALLIRACEPVTQAHCHDVADNQIDTGDLMECLVQNKHQKEMNEKCSVGVTHFQLIQMKDFRFSYKFKMACKEDVLRLCPNIKKKVDVVICLSTTVRNDTLQEAKEQRVSLKCRKQLRVEELEMSEDIRLEPELYDPCKSDISRLCPNVAFGNAQMIECLKEQKKQLSPRCHQRIFRLQEVEMTDPELDYQLMRVCKQMIKRFCTEADARNVLQCLKQNKNSELMDPKCKQMITKRQITQNTDYRLNPVLRKACRADIPKFCQPILNKASEDSELEGQVVACLKLKYADQVGPRWHCLLETDEILKRLSPDCEDQIRVILQESALDYRLDPQLQMHCSDEISKLCAEEAAAQEQTGQVEECLKVNLLKIKQDTCKKEVLNMLKESKADIFVDPVLHTACALDLKHHCAAITPGRGRQMSCLMEALQDKRVRLQPECKKRLQDRIDMWSYAAKVAPAEGFSDLAVQVMTSPSKNYILLMIALSVCVLFLVGLLCGRITKRVTRELKDR